MMFAAVYRPRCDIDDSLDGKLMMRVAHHQKVLLDPLCCASHCQVQKNRSKFANAGSLLILFMSPKCQARLSMITAAR
jgi:hypothetical protein